MSGNPVSTCSVGNVGVAMTRTGLKVPLTSFTGRLVLKLEGGENSGTLSMELSDSDFESESSMVFFLGFAQLFLVMGYFDNTIIRINCIGGNVVFDNREIRG